MNKNNSIYAIIIILLMAVVLLWPLPKVQAGPAYDDETETFTETSSETATVPTDTATFTSSPSLTPSFTPTDTPTFTPTNTSTFTPTFTSTSTSTFTPTYTPSSTNTLNASEAWTATYGAANVLYSNVAAEDYPTTIILSILCGIILLTLIVLGTVTIIQRRR
jgi:cytoskeletal protein RodZ